MPPKLRTFRTPSPPSGSDEEANEVYPDEIQLPHDDLTFRKDFVDHKPNPFSGTKLLSKRMIKTLPSSQDRPTKKRTTTGKVRPADINPDEPKEKEEAKKAKAKAKDTGVHMEGGWEIRTARPVVRGAGRGRGGKGTRGRSVTAWTNSRGETVPGTYAKKDWKQPTVTLPAPVAVSTRPSVKRLRLDDIDGILAEDTPGKPRDEIEDNPKGTTKAIVPDLKKKKRAKKGSNDVPVFKRIPAGAGPTDEFPIVKALQRQKNLPTKAKKGKATQSQPVVVSPDSSEASPIQALDLDKLIRGLDNPADSTKRRVPAINKATIREESVEVFSDDLGLSEDELPVFNLGKTQPGTLFSKYFNQTQPRQIPIQPKPLNGRSRTTNEDQVPSLYHSKSTNELDAIETPYWSGAEDRVSVDPMDGVQSDPSTITHIPSDPSTNQKANVATSSSSALPYSSPLESKLAHSKHALHAHVVRPEVRRADILQQASNPVGRLERMASLGYDGAGHERVELKASNRNQPSQPASTFNFLPGATPPSNPPLTHRQAPQDRWLQPATESDTDWTTLQPKRLGGPRANLLTHHPEPPKLSDKFHIPGPLFPPRMNRQDPPASPPPTFSRVTSKKLFTPSAPSSSPPMEAVRAPPKSYKIHTLRGDHYGAQGHSRIPLADTRGGFQPIYPPAYSTFERSYGNANQDRQLGNNSQYISGHQGARGEEPWEEAWKRPEGAREHRRSVLDRYKLESWSPGDEGEANHGRQGYGRAFD